MPIMSHNCVSVQQDALHGEGKRVVNKTAKKDPQEYRCTVCGQTITKGGPALKKKTK